MVVEACDADAVPTESVVEWVWSGIVNKTEKEKIEYISNMKTI